MTNSWNNNGKNSGNEVVLARFLGDEARKIIAELKANHSLRFSIIQDEEDGNPPLVELIKDV